MILTKEEATALRGTQSLEGVDQYRQAIIFGKLNSLIFLIHAVLDHAMPNEDMNRAKQISKIAHAVDVGTVAHLVNDPSALQTLNKLAQHALELPTPDS